MRKTRTSTIKLLLFLLWGLSTAIVTVMFPVWLIPSAHGQTCKVSNLYQKVEQFRDRQKLQLAKDILNQCGEASVVPLVDALSDRNKTIRINAAQVLGAIGAEAHPAIPILLATGQDDGNLEVRHSALQALALIGQDLKIQADSLTGWQIEEIQILQNLVQGIDQTLGILEKDKTEWQTKAEDLEALRLARNGLQSKLDRLTTLPSYQVRGWIKNNLWVLFLLLIGCIVISTVKILPIRYRERILNFFAPIFPLLESIPFIGKTTIEALEKVLKASDLKYELLELNHLDGYPILEHHSDGKPIYTKGFHINMKLYHNGQGKELITIYRMEIKIEDYQLNADYTYQQKGEKLIGAGPGEEHEFSILLSGLSPGKANWITDIKKGEFVQARSTNILDTPGGIYKFQLTAQQTADDSEYIKGNIVAQERGLYRVRFYFSYEVDGEKRSQETASYYIYHKGD